MHSEAKQTEASECGAEKGLSQDRERPWGGSGAEKLRAPGRASAKHFFLNWARQNLSQKGKKNLRNWRGNTSFKNYYYLFSLYQVAYRILVLWPGIERRSLAVNAYSPNHWTTREFRNFFILVSQWKQHLFRRWKEIMCIFFIQVWSPWLRCILGMVTRIFPDKMLAMTLYPYLITYLCLCYHIFIRF